MLIKPNTFPVRLSAWITLQALIAVQIFPPFAFAHELRVSQVESKTGIEEIRQQLAGVEEPQTLEQAMDVWFRPGGTQQQARSDEIDLQNWLVLRGEGAIREFMGRVAEDRGIDVKQLGPYEIPPLKLDFKQLQDARQRFVTAEELGRTIPPRFAEKYADEAERYYEYERLTLMAQVAIQRVLGRQILVDVGLGYVGTASLVVNANTVADPRLLPKMAGGTRYRSPIREPGMFPFFAIAYQRPSSSFYKIQHVRAGDVPMPSGDPRGPGLIREALGRGNIAATPLMESITVADIVLSETELHPERPVPDDPAEAQIVEEPTLKLLDRVASLVPGRETLILVVSTVTPGFTGGRVLPVVAEQLKKRGLVQSQEEVLLGHAPQRMDPGADWFGWLRFQRHAAGVNAASHRVVKQYLDVLYSAGNRSHWELKGRPPRGGAYILYGSPSEVETGKGWENAWRYQLMGLGVPLLQSAEVLGVNAWELAHGIARSRPQTHGLVNVIAAIPGGFCVPNQLYQMMTGVRLDLQRNGVPTGMVDLELQKIFRSPIMGSAVIEARGQDLVRDHLVPALERAGKRLDRSSALLAGVAFKEETDETRQSGSEIVARTVAHWGGKVSAVDEYVRIWAELAGQDLSDPESRGYRLSHQEQLRGLKVKRGLLQTVLAEQPDAVVLITRHPQYVGSGQPAEARTNHSTGQVLPGLDVIDLVAHTYGRSHNVVIDTFNFLTDPEIKQLLALDWEVAGFGKGHIWARLSQEITVRDRIDAVGLLLDRLEEKRDNGAFNQDLLQKAIRVQERRLQFLRAQLSTAAGVEESSQLLEARYQVESTRLALELPVDPERRQVLEAQLRLGEARIRLLETQQGIQAHGGLADLQQAVREAEDQFKRVAGVYRSAGGAHVRREILDPLLKRTSVEMLRLARLMNMLSPRLEDPSRLMLPDSAALLARVAGHLGIVLDDINRAHSNLDRLMVELVPEEERAELARLLRHAEFDPALRVPQPAPRGPLLVSAPHPLVPATLYSQGPDGRLRLEVAPGREPSRLAIKTVPNMAEKDGELRDKNWVKYSMQVPLNEVEAQILDFEEFPDAQGLPWQFRLYLRDLIKRGRILSTLEGQPQDQIGFLMDVNLDPKTPDHRRGRGGVLFFLDNRQPLVSTDRSTGIQFIAELKAAGTHLGGSPEQLVAKEAKLRAGRSAGGAVARATAVQIPGHQGNGWEVVPMMDMRLTQAYKEGKTPRALYRIRFKYKGDSSGNEYEVIFRAAPTSRRLGHRFVGDPDAVPPSEAARHLAYAASELLALDMATVHIALNGDNVLANGYPTDTGSFVRLFNERDPYAAFSNYFGFYLSFILYTFEQFDRGDYAHPNTEFLGEWARAFFEHLFAAQDTSRVHNPGAFQALLAPTPEQLADPEQRYVQPLIDTVWQQYLPYRLLENRIRFGYDPTAESAYTAANESEKQAMYHPESEAHARAFLRSQREILTIARRLIGEEGYPPLTYHTGERAGQPFDFEAALRELDRKEQELAEISEDYSGVYRLSFYGPRRPDRYDVVDTRGQEREQIFWSTSADAFEKPDTAAAARLRKKRQEEEAVKPAQPAKAGAEELQTTYTLADLARIAADPVGTGLKAVVEKSVEAPYVEKELRKAAKLIQAALQKKQFLPDLPIALVRTTGRARNFMGHPDLGAVGSFSIDSATHQSIWMLVQMTDDGKVIADNLDPQYGSLKEFGIQDQDVLPLNAALIAQPRPEWLQWAQSHTFENRWEGLVKGTLAVIRTKMIDPKGERRNDLSRKGLRILLSESDIPSGKGFSASSSIPAGIGLSLNALWEGRNAKSLVLSREDLRKLDYAAYVVDDLAGVADITAIFEGELGQATVLWYDPNEVGQKLVFPPDFRVFAFDSNVKRLNHTSYPPPVRNYGKHIQTLTNVSVPFAVLWLRMLARNHPEDLGFLEEVLTAHWPSGVVRELTEAPAAAIRLPQYAGKVVPRGQPPARGRGAEQKRRQFVAQVMARVPNEWTLGQIVAALRQGLPPNFYPEIDNLAQELVPLGAHELDASTVQGQRKLQELRNNTIIPMRQMALYGIQETQRGLAYIASAERGDSRALIRLMREAHNGDRAIYDPNQPYLAGTPLLTPWGLNNPIEAFQRSLVKIDRFVGRFESEVEKKLGRKEAVAGRISGAGLGGLVMGGLHLPVKSRRESDYQTALKHLRSLRPAHEVIEISPSAGARIIRLPSLRAAAAGVEENFEKQGLDYRALREVVLRGADSNPVIWLPNGTGIAAEGGDAEVRIAPGVVFEQGVRIVAPQGQRVRIGEKSRILAQSQIVGNVTVAEEVGLDAIVTGNTLVGKGTQFSRGSKTVVHNSVLLPLPGAKPVPVSVNQTASIRDSVVWGSSLFQGTKVLNSLLIYALMGNDAMASRSVLMGLSPDNRTSAAHHNDLISLFSIPLAVRLDLTNPVEQGRLRDQLLALRFGTVESRKQRILVQTGHPSRPEETWVVRLAGRLFEIIARASNLGAHNTTSNFDPRNEGSKGPTLLWGGIAAGVGSIFSAPVEVGPGSLVSNNAVVSGRDALAAGSLVLSGSTAGGAVKPGYLIDNYGRLGKGVRENVAVRLQVIRLLETAISVAGVGSVRSQDEMERAGYLREAKLLQTYLAEGLADLERYLALVEASERNLARDPGRGDSGKRLEEQREVLGQRENLLGAARQASETAATAVASSEKGSAPHRMADVVTFRNPRSIVELLPGSPAFSAERIEAGLQKVREGTALFVIFRAGRASRFSDSVKQDSQRYYDHARQRGRLDDQGGASKLTAPLGVAGFGPDLHQLEALAELGRRAGRPVDVVIVDSAGNRAMLLALMRADQARQTPRVAWEYLNLISEPESQDGLVDQGEGLEVTTLDGRPIYEWNPATGRRDKPVKAPSGEYGAFMAGIRAAQSAGIDVTARDIVPVYGDQAGLYTDPDFDAALLGNLGDADVTAVAVQHRRAGDRWVPDGGVIPEVEWGDGRTAVVIAERDSRDPKLAAQGIYNPRLDEQEQATEGYFPYNAGAPVFSAPFVGALLGSRVDLRKQVKTRQVKTGPGPQDSEAVQVLVSELELTQLVQIASEQGRRVQVLRTELERRQALKYFQDVAPANRRIFEQGRLYLRTQLGGRLEGNLSFIEVGAGAARFQVSGEGRLVIGEGVGVVVDRWGLWTYALEGEENGSPFFGAEGRLLIPAGADGTIIIDRPIEATLSAAGVEQDTDEAVVWAERATRLYGITAPAHPAFGSLRELLYDSQMDLTPDQYRQRWGELLRVLPAGDAGLQDTVESFQRQGISLRSLYGTLLRHRESQEGVLVVGEQGTGKSTVAALLAGQDESSDWEFMGDDALVAFQAGGALIAGISPVQAAGSLRPRTVPSRGFYPTSRFVPVRRVVWLFRQDEAAVPLLSTLAGRATSTKSVYYPEPFKTLISSLPRIEIPVPGKSLQQDSLNWYRQNVIPLIAVQAVPAAGTEELPPTADPTSAEFDPARYVVSSPAAAAPRGEATLPFETADPARLLQLVQAGQRVVLSPKMNRVGEKLWDKQAHRGELQFLYRLYYDIAEGRKSLSEDEINRVVSLLNVGSQAVAAAARDVIVKARVHGLGQTVKEVVRLYKQRVQASPAGPYAAHYMKDALTARLDLAHRMELGSPETPVFAGEMTGERVGQLQKQLQRFVDPKNRLSMLTGSGQRMAAPIDEVDAGLQTGSFPPQELMVDIGSQPHDVVKVLFGLVAKLFAENMPQWRKEFGRTDDEKAMPKEWTVAIGMDPRSTGPAILQVAARIFEQAGVKVKFIGITSAPEAAARALLADPKENILACYMITPSHIAQGYQGTKLMLWTGQIMPWAAAERFNDQIRAAAQDIHQVRQVIEWLQQNPDMDARISEVLARMPAEYAVSKKLYHEYLLQTFTGTAKTGRELEQEAGRLAQELKKAGVTVVLDTNGGARIPDLPVYDRIFGGYLVIGADAAQFAHSLPPGEISSRALMEFGARIAPVFDAAGLCCLWVNPDPDGDRKGIVYRSPSGQFLYLDPQAGYLLDVLNHVLSAQETGVPGVGVVGNEATTIVAKILEQRLGYKLLVTETGEANVVQGMNRLLAQLQQEQGGDRSKVAVLGGEGSAAATIAGDVQVRDMIQGVVSMVNFFQKPERVKKLIELLVDNAGEKARLLGEVDSWYRPGRLQFLLYHIVHEVLPAMRNTDPGYDTEVHQGVGIANQQPFKDTADRLLAPGGEWAKVLRLETADVLQVPPNRIRISDPINSIEDYQLTGAGNRALPDGRVIHDGGYEVHVFYTDPTGKEQFLYKLEFRRSKTQVGDTRRLVFNAVTFLPRAQAEDLASRLYDRTRSLWLGFLNDLEAEELWGHVQGSFGLPVVSTLEDLELSLNRLLANTRQARAVRVDRLMDRSKTTYSPVDAQNIEQQDAAARGAVQRLDELLRQISPALVHLQGGRLREGLEILRAPFQVSPGLVPPSAGDRNESAEVMARNLITKVLGWKIERLIGPLAPDSAPGADVTARIDRLVQVLGELRQFADRGTSAQNPREGITFSNLVNAKVLLAGELEQARAAAATAAGAEERAPITEETAAEVVRGWDGLGAAQRQAVLQSLAGHGYTLEKHARHKALVLTGEQNQPAVFQAFPPSLDGRPGSPDYDRLIQAGGSPEVLNHEGVIIAAAGEGSRLLKDSIAAGLLPSNGLELYTKPTVPVLPVTGGSALSYQLQTLADLSATKGVPLPVKVALHEEVGMKVDRMIEQNHGFGLAHWGTVFQGMNPALDNEGKVVLKEDGTVSFNPDGTGGVIQAVLRSGGSQWFESLLGPEAHLSLIGGDNLLDPALIELSAGAGRRWPVVGIGYPYPHLRDPANPNPATNHQFKLGTFATLGRNGHHFTQVIEYRERGAVSGFQEAVSRAEELGQPVVQAASGLYGLRLRGLWDKIRNLPPHHQRDKDAAGVTGKVQKIELFAPDIPIEYDPAEVGVLSVDQAILTPIKDPNALRQVRQLAVERERERARQAGVALAPESRTEFHPAMNRPGRLVIGQNVRAEGPVGLYFRPGGVRLYTRFQPDKPWEPFDPASAIELFTTQPGQPVVIPEGTLFTVDGVRTATAAGTEETKTRAFSPVSKTFTQDQKLDQIPETRIAVVSYEATQRNPELRPYVGQLFRMGNAWLLVLPKNSQETFGLLQPVIEVVSHSLKVWEYGEPGDASLIAFQHITEGAVEILGRASLQDQTLHQILRLILANLRGVEPAAIPDSDIGAFEEALLFA